MATADQRAAQFLLMGASAYASLASQRLLTDHPALAESFGNGSRESWKKSLEGRLGELSAALQEGSCDPFIERVIWSRAAFEARGVPVDFLAASLQCLRGVLGQELPESAREPATRFLDEALARLASEDSAVPTFIDQDSPNGKRAASFLHAVLSGERRQAAQLIREPVTAGKLTVPEVYQQILIPVQREMGRMWLLDEVNIAEEHFVTATTKMVMSQLLSMAPEAPSRGRTVVSAAVSGDIHDVGVQAVSDFFEMDGWRVISLGANVPAADIAAAVRDFSAHLLALSATLLTQLDAMRETIQSVRENSPQCKIMVGGTLFSDRSTHDVGADETALSLPDAVEVGQRLVGLTQD